MLNKTKPKQIKQNRKQNLRILPFLFPTKSLNITFGLQKDTVLQPLISSCYYHFELILILSKIFIADWLLPSLYLGSFGFSYCILISNFLWEYTAIVLLDSAAMASAYALALLQTLRRCIPHSGIDETQQATLQENKIPVLGILCNWCCLDCIQRKRGFLILLMQL